MAVVQGLFRKEGVFLRTPKEDERNRMLSALWSARTESLLALLLWGSGVAILTSDVGNWFLVMLLAWQGVVYASALFMAWSNARTKLPPELERRRRTEWLREGRGLRWAFYAGAAAALVALGIMATIVTIGGSNPGTHVRNPFSLPQKAAGPTSPIGSLVTGGGASPSPTATPLPTASPTISPTPTASPSPSASASPTP